MSKSRARTDADLAEGEEEEKNPQRQYVSFDQSSISIKERKSHFWKTSLLCLNLHPSPLICLGNSLSLEQKERKKHTLQDIKHLVNYLLPLLTGLSKWINTLTQQSCTL